MTDAEGCKTAIRRDLFSLIPAHAGVIPPATKAQPPWKAYPRARGGDPLHEAVFLPASVLIPAHAGVILALIDTQDGSVAYPRARGGDPMAWAPPPWKACLSPRTRG